MLGQKEERALFFRARPDLDQMNLLAQAESDMPSIIGG